MQHARNTDSISFDNPLISKKGLYGAAFDEPARIAFLPEQLRTLTAGDIANRTRSVTLARNLNNIDEFIALADKMYSFTSRSLFSDGNDIVSLYRGHRLYKDVSAKQLLSAAQRSGQYLARAVDANGKFAYSYLAGKDRLRDNYNIVRHAGTIYAMMELYGITREPELLKSAERAIEYMLRTVKPYKPGKENMACVIEDGYIKLGANALAIVAMAKYTEATGNRKKPVHTKQHFLCLSRQPVSFT